MSLHDDYTRLRSEREQLQRALTEERAALKHTLGERPALLDQLHALFQRRFPLLIVTPDASAVLQRQRQPVVGSAPSKVAVAGVEVWPESDPMIDAQMPASGAVTPAAQHDDLERLIADGEALLTQLTIVSPAEAARAESVLVIDLRSGWVEPFVAVPQFGGRIAAEPCFVQVEGGAAGSDSRSRARMLAHRSTDNGPWKAVSQAYFDELINTSAGETTVNALETAAAAPPGPASDRLLSAFLPRNITVDYDRVAFVVDAQNTADWLRGFLNRMSQRLDTDGRTRWRDAMLLVVDAALETAPFACFTDLETADNTEACVLLFDAPDKARMLVVRNDGSVQKTNIDQTQATHVLLVGTPQNTQPGVLTFHDMDALRTAGLIGFLQPQLRVDESRVTALRDECTRLQEQLAAQRSRTSDALQINQRAERVLTSA
jgi:hypothetical protein